MTDKSKRSVLNSVAVVIGVAALAYSFVYALVTVLPKYQKSVSLRSLAYALVADVLFLIPVKKGGMAWRITGLLCMLPSLIPFYNFIKMFPYVFR